ncbi:unnamed protein product [Bursaphelenchus okinawaensis]|uniref:Uncharacterized protein n=1 Tax=Bursaphelenchus okinawaensis TaxID=465554 RepID=A0A811KAR1_9BILA|nr:unnamed protein product [Bursaphelenchus okinawaensis]CAG9096193.1 unnamed protein product [Bursaphelenchus okinawaensis]
MKLFFVFLLLTVATRADRRDGREFEEYGTILCPGASSCLGKRCSVKFVVALADDDYRDLSESCSTFNIWPDGRYHIRCNAKYDDSKAFYLQYIGHCHPQGQPSEREYKIPPYAREFVFAGDIVLKDPE